jgi:tetratricopeptide (TPR) repeat protein
MRIPNAWPFRDRSAPTELPPAASEGDRLTQALYRQEINWAQAQDALRRHADSQGDTQEFARITLILADAFPFVPALQFDAARALIAVGRAPDAVRYGRRAIELAPQDLNHLLVHAHAAALSGLRNEAEQSLQRVLELDPANETARRALQQLELRPSSAAPRP